MFLDTMMHEYHMPMQEVIHHLPIAAGMALFEAVRARRGIDDGNGYVDRMARTAAKEMRKFIEQNYEVV